MVVSGRVGRMKTWPISGQQWILAGRQAGLCRMRAGILKIAQAQQSGEENLQLESRLSWGVQTCSTLFFMREAPI